VAPIELVELALSLVGEARQFLLHDSVGDHRMRPVVPLLFVCIASATPGFGQAVQSPPCKGPDFRSLDFWVGDWVAEDQQGKRIGTNHVTRDEYGECVIAEHFRTDDGSLIGHSVSIYRPALKQWRQTWVDNQNGYFDLIGGPASGSDYIFYFENQKLTDAQPYLRMIWQDVKPDSFTWRWQKRTKPDEAWADSWVIHYRRQGAASASK
jgi:hypothetical protein